MTEQTTQHVQKTEEKKKITAKPLPVDKEKAREIEQGKHIGHTDHAGEHVHHEPSSDNKNSTEEKKDSKKPAKVEVQKVKKYEAVARGASLPISKKQSMYIGKFIKNKKIDRAIADLQLVIAKKKAVPFKGEIPHRKGNIMSGRYPVKAAGYFINLLKGLKGNVLVNGMELDNTIIYLVSPSWAVRPMRRGGMSAKRVNIIVKAKELSSHKGGKK